MCIRMGKLEDKLTTVLYSQKKMIRSLNQMTKIYRRMYVQVDGSDLHSIASGDDDDAESDRLNVHNQWKGSLSSMT